MGYTERNDLLYTKLSGALKHFNVAVTHEQVKAEKELIEDDEPPYTPLQPGEIQAIDD